MSLQEVERAESANWRPVLALNSNISRCRYFRLLTSDLRNWFPAHLSKIKILCHVSL
jgi:hypothetical protein